MISSIFRQSLLTKISLMVVLTSTLTLGALGLWEYNATRNRMEKALAEEVGMLAERMALAFVKIIWDYDQKLADSIILSEMKQRQIAGILVWEEGGTQALFGAWRTPNGKIIMADAPFSHSGLIASGHVILRKKIPIGKVRVFLADRYLKESLRVEMWTVLIRVVLLDVVMVLLLIFLIRSFLTEPMSTLRNAMDGMQQGKLDQKVDVKSTDEIGQIADAFNKMAEQLNKRDTQLVESEEKFSALVNQAADALFLHDANGNFLDINQRSCQSLGYTREELLHMNVSDVDVYYNDEDRIIQFSEKLRPGTPLTFESENRRKDGSTFPVEVSLGLIQIKGKQVILSLARDISERKAAEVALQSAHDELEVKVAERTKEMSIAKNQAEAANMAKSNFLARMSHEIRTPLNAVKGLTQIVLKSELTDKQHDFLSKVQIATNNLSEVINDILDFSKVEAGRLELAHAPFDLDQVLAELSDLFSNRVSQKDIELVISVERQVPRLLIGDAGRLNQILTNLVENAVKFTDSGEIVIEAELGKPVVERNDDVTLKFRVKDNGGGITADLLPNLFDPFTQADSSLTRQHEGTGLGLAICRHLVTLMGGGIKVNSTHGHGSTFTFTVVMAFQKELNPQFHLPTKLHGLKALVVDDSETARKVLVDILESFTFNVAAVDSGEKAIEAFKLAAQEPYRLVLLDWKMPGMDGIATAQRIRELECGDPSANRDTNMGDSEQPGLHDRPYFHASSMASGAGKRSHHCAPIIIMVTAYGQKILQEGVDLSSVNTSLQKPARPSQLFNLIMDLFNQQAVDITRPDTRDDSQPSLMAGRRVLVVEDSDLNRLVATALLEEKGLTVEIAANGKLAVEKVTGSKAQYYGAVLMDIQMPVMDGYEATRRIRDWEENARPAGPQSPVTGIPIIALTAHAMKGEKEKCIAAGMNDYLAKPIDEKLMHHVLDKWIQPLKCEDHAHSCVVADQTSEDPEVLDVHGALKRLGGREYIYIDALRHFRGECGKSHEAIVQTLADGRSDSALRLAHTVKGTAAAVGAIGLSQIAGELESSIDAQESDLDDLLASFNKNLHLTLNAIDDHLETVANS